MKTVVQRAAREPWKSRGKAESAAESKDFADFSVAFLAVTAILGVVLHDAAMVTDFSRKILLPV